MSTLLLVAAVAGIDIGAKILGHSTITQELRRNKAEACIGLLWLAVHVLKEDRDIRHD